MLFLTIIVPRLSHLNFQLRKHITFKLKDFIKCLVACLKVVFLSFPKLAELNSTQLNSTQLNSSLSLSLSLSLSFSTSLNTKT
jgi:hypothetical protein